LSLAALLGATACGPFHRGATPSAYIRFVNDAIDQVDVYAVPMAGDQIRIGTVDGGRTVRLRLPDIAIGADGTVNIIARVFAGNRAPRTGRIPISPGDELQVTLPPEENMLTVLPAPHR